MHIEFFVEEESAASALRELLPRLLGARATFNLRTFQGKPDLLANLPLQLRAYRKWLPVDHRLVVLVDRDDDDCRTLKAQLEMIATGAGFNTKSAPDGAGQFQVINRIAIEELEAWFFRDVAAITAAYPRVPATLSRRRGFRDPDAVTGGTWEALERVLKRNGYYPAGLPKIEAARNIAGQMQPDRNTSRSFQVFRQALVDLTAV